MKDEQIKKLKQKIGDLVLDNDILREALKPYPLDRKTSRKLPRQGDSSIYKRTSGCYLGLIRRGRLSCQGVMGPLFVILPHPLRTDLAHLIQRLEHIDVEYLVAEGPIGSINRRAIPRSVRQVIKRSARNSGALSSRMACGWPRQTVTCSSTRITRSAGNDVSTSMANTSRTPSSRIFKVRNRRPPYTVSLNIRGHIL